MNYIWILGQYKTCWRRSKCLLRSSFYLFYGIKFFCGLNILHVTHIQLSQICYIWKSSYFLVIVFIISYNENLLFLKLLQIVEPYRPVSSKKDMAVCPLRSWTLLPILPDVPWEVEVLRSPIYYCVQLFHGGPRNCQVSYQPKESWIPLQPSVRQTQNPLRDQRDQLQKVTFLMSAFKVAEGMMDVFQLLRFPGSRLKFPLRFNQCRYELCNVMRQKHRMPRGDEDVWLRVDKSNAP